MDCVLHTGRKSLRQNDTLQLNSHCIKQGAPKTGTQARSQHMHMYTWIRIYSNHPDPAQPLEMITNMENG